MIKLGILGYPLGHTLSPVMHTAAFNDVGLEAEYNILETPPEKLDNVIDFIKANNYTGFNVTIPHKVSIIKYLETMDEFAKLAGAVNTVKISEGKLYGYNTDIYGFINAFTSEDKDFLKGKAAAVLGAGGASRAIAIGLAHLGLSKITFYVRNISAVKVLVNELSSKFPNTQFNYGALSENIDLSEISLLVNTTPIGMQGEYENLSPVSQACVETLPVNAIVYDIVYKPKITKLLGYAKKHNLKVIDGSQMFILQGAKAFEIWTGMDAPVKVMNEAVNNSL